MKDELRAGAITAVLVALTQKPTQVDPDGTHHWSVIDVDAWLAGRTESRDWTARPYMRGGKRLTPVAPGIYEVQGEHAGVFNIPELIAFVGLDDTQENREQVMEICRSITSEHTKLVIQELRDDA